MNKILKILVLSLIIFVSIPTVFVHASEHFENEYPYDTYTVDYSGNLTYTQTAYTPVGVFNRDLELFNPEDIYIKDDLVYVADTGNKRVVVLDYSGVLQLEIGLGVLEQPTGVFVSEDDFLYVADKTNQLVYKYDLDGVLIRTFGRPTEPLFGEDSPFTPIKVVVGSGENIYIIGDGSTSGVIQLNYDGSFLGYFGVNLSDKSLIQRIADVFVNEDEYASSTPPSPTNIAINSKSLVYTSTPNTETALKKLDVNGSNILTTTNYHVEQNIVDISVDDSGYLYAIYDDGFIAEYDPNGNLIFAFDVVSSSTNRLGLIQNPSAIQIDSHGNLFVLDKGRSEIVTYQPTNFTSLVHDAIDFYNQGNYAESTTYFEAILNQNDNFALAHSALGKAYYQNGDYDQALNEYFKANDIQGYSTTFWKIRDIWLKDNLTVVFVLLISLIVLSKTIKLVNRKSNVFAPVNKKISKVKTNKQVRKYTLVFHIMKHPIDSNYEIKREKRADYLSATIVLFVLFIEYLLYLSLSGYIFTGNVENINLGMEAAKFFGLIFLFIFSNYLVSTLHNGEGWFKDVYISVIYSLSPMIILLPFYIILTNLLTLNETILLDILGFVMITYTLVLVFVAVREIHNYEIKETFKNIFITLFTMAIIIIVGFIVYVFGNQLIDFLISWFKEVFFRVFS